MDAEVINWVAVVGGIIAAISAVYAGYVTFQERKEKKKAEKELFEARRRSEAPFFEYYSSSAHEDDMSTGLRVFRVEMKNSGESCRKYKFTSKTSVIEFVSEEPLHGDMFGDYNNENIFIGFTIPFIETKNGSIIARQDHPTIDDIVLDFDVNFECPRTGLKNTHSYRLTDRKLIRTDPI